MKCAIVDDEKRATDLFCSYMKRFEEENQMSITVVAYNSPNTFLENYSNDFELVLMDVEMPGLDGFQTAREIRRMDRQVVLMFITNMAQYAINGYEVEAIDYVIKPVVYQDFALKIKKAIRYVARNHDEKLVLNTQAGIKYLNLSDIYYIEVMKHYLVYHTVDGDYTVRGVMKDMEEKLCQWSFVRCHHCYLVNMKYVESINGNVLKVAGEQLTVSRNKKSELLTAFAKYVGGM